MMNCREFVDFLMAYLNEDLPKAERDAFKMHIVDCPPCVNFLDTYAETIKLEKGAYDSLGYDDMPPQLVQAILAAQEK